MKLRSLITLLSLTILTSLQSQSKTDLRELYDEGEYFFQRKDFPEAFYYFVQLIKHEPNNANYNFKAGACLINMPGQEKKAIPMLEKAIKEINPNYNRRSFNERGAPLHAYYYLGNAYRINNEIDKALEVYKQFINSPDFYGNYNERMVFEEIKSCERAKIIKDAPIQLHEENLGPGINTKTDDYHAVVSGNDQTMVFVSTLKFYEGIFFTQKSNGLWLEPVNINAQVLSDGDMFPTGLSYDGKKMLLVKRADVNNDIFISEFDGRMWSKAMPISENINSRNNEDYASFSKDGNTIYFTSDRRGGNGGFDIYKSVKAGDTWGKPENLGDVVNSPFDEKSPFITADGKYLYFSSNGHFTMGGYDIFYSEMEDGVWLRPVNAGYPLNTTSDNIFFVPVLEGKEGYISLMKDEGHGGQDIYRVAFGIGAKIDQAKAERSMDKIDMDNSLKLKLIDEVTRDTTIIYFNTMTQRFHFEVPEGKKVIFEE
jgi:tetratricopeptide (TPR) repeat protein